MVAREVRPHKLSDMTPPPSTRYVNNDNMIGGVVAGNALPETAISSLLPRPEIGIEREMGTRRVI